MNNRRAISAGLALLLLLLAVDFVHSVLLYSPATITPQETPKARVEGPSVPGPPRAASWGAEIAERNLFDESRARVSSSSSPGSQGSLANAASHEALPPLDQGIRPDIKLSGIMKNQFGEYVAIIQIGTDAPVSLRTGEALKGVKVIKIDKRAVMLESEKGSFELKLSGTPLIKR